MRKKVLKSRHNSNPKMVFVDVTYNQLFAILLRPCLSLRKRKNKQKMRLFRKIVRKMKGKTEKYLFLTDSLWTLRFFVISFVLTNAERSHTMTTEEKIKGLEHLLRKCPDVITALQASRLIHVSKNTIHAAINEGKLIAYAYRGKRLISKADFIDYLAATTDDETAWQRRQRERMSHEE